MSGVPTSLGGDADGNDVGTDSAPLCDSRPEDGAGAGAGAGHRPAFCSTHMFDLLCSHTRKQGGGLSRRIRLKRVSPHDSGFFARVKDVLSSPSPLSESLSIRQLQALLMVGGILLMTISCRRAILNTRVIVPTAQCLRVRFTVFSLQGGTLPLNRTGSLDSSALDKQGFGLVLNGCEFATTSAWHDGRTMSAEGGSGVHVNSVVQYHHPWTSAPGELGTLDFNGFFFRTGQDPGLDAQSFQIECEKDEGEWRLVAAPGRCGWFPAAEPKFLDRAFPESESPAAENRFQVPLMQVPGDTAIWDYTTSQCKESTLLRWISRTLFASTLMCTAVLGHHMSHTDTPELCSPVQLLACGASLCNVLRIAGSLLSFRIMIGDLLVNVVTLIHWCSVLVMSEYFMSERIILLGAFRLIVFRSVAPDYNAFGQKISVDDIVEISLISCFYLCLGTAAICTRYFLLMSQQREVAQDKAKLDIALQALEATAREDLLQLEAIVDRLYLKAVRSSTAQSPVPSFSVLLPTGGLQPMHRIYTDHSPGDDMATEGRGIFGLEEDRRTASIIDGDPDAGENKRETSVVRCLDQLYFQASVVAPAFLSKVQRWSKASQASFPLKRVSLCEDGFHAAGPTPLVRWQTLVQVPALRARVDFVPIQSAEVATRKALLKYGGDPSLVVDLVRQILVFDSVSDQMDCLQALELDPDVRIVSISNTQTVSNTSHIYVKPAVKVSLVIDTPYTRLMNVSGHVCQLKLMLKDIWLLYDRETHQRYMSYRRCLDLQRTSLTTLFLTRFRASLHRRQHVVRVENAAKNMADVRTEVVVPPDVSISSRTLSKPFNAVCPEDVEAKGGRHGCQIGAALLPVKEKNIQIERETACEDSPGGFAADSASNLEMKHNLMDYFGLEASECAESLATEFPCQSYGNAVCHDECAFSPILSLRLGEQQVSLPTILDAAAQSFQLNDVLLLLLTDFDSEKREFEATRWFSNDVHSSGSLLPNAASKDDHDWLDQADSQQQVVMQIGQGRHELLPSQHDLMSIFRHKCRFSFQYLQQRLLDSKLFSKSSPWVSILHSSFPITGAMSKWQMQFCVMAVGLGFLVTLIRPAGFFDVDSGLILQYIGNNMVTSSHFRFRPIQTRDGGDGGSIQSLSILRNGCAHKKGDLVVGTTQREVQGVAYEVTYASVTDSRILEANGFAFQTSSTKKDPRQDPAEFDFAYCKDRKARTWADCDESSWEVVGGSECLFSVFSLRCHVVAGRKLAVSDQRGFEHTFDLRSPWWHSILVISRSALAVSGNFMAVTAGILGRVHTARRLFGTVTFALNGIVNGLVMAFAMFIVYPVGSYQALAGILPLVAGLVYSGLLGGTILFQENRIFSGRFPVGLYGPLLVLMPAIFDFKVVHGGGEYVPKTLGRGGGIEIVVILAAWVLVKYMKNRIFNQAKIEIQVDRDNYEREWRLLLETPENVRTLARIAHLTSTHDGSIEIKPRLEQNEQVQSSMLLWPSNSLKYICERWTIFGMEKETHISVAHPSVESLDQLYLQAQVLWPIFNGVVYKWAVASNGMVTTVDSELKLASDTHFSDVKWASIKGATRAIEKLQRSYNNDVSRLVDVVRQQIVFSSLDDLCNCLSIISSGSESRNLRMKNRFALNFDADSMGGYRDVAVNLVIETQETLLLGVSGHVCELQLLLQQFYACKSDDGHKRYVEYRNKRAE